ncbi:hypothetical protein L6452_07172 [Arctium lappa]|uniref:Uncharacterized protein n=1 Tax=Arctium lappa TaxID=4217 RepID=A0ACB9EL88_ARCLA|nr:hypothetical protein L6452_07172 [Arctium lappa]
MDDFKNTGWKFMLRPCCLAKSLHRSPKIFAAQFLLHSPLLHRRLIAATMTKALRSTYLRHRPPLFSDEVFIYAYSPHTISLVHAKNPSLFDFFPKRILNPVGYISNSCEY